MNHCIHCGRRVNRGRTPDEPRRRNVRRVSGGAAAQRLALCITSDEALEKEEV